jgi:predicted nicotinamide N-methyase
MHGVSSELHLSDVSLHRKGAASEHSLLQTTFVFALHPRATTTSSVVYVDDDGDLLIQRKKRLTLRHNGATSLDSVALQIWPASILLADYIIHIAEQEKIMGCVVELGSGCSALASLITSLVRPSLPIFATDAHLESLYCLADNVKSNNIGSNVRIRKLNWMTDDIDLLASSPAGLFDWTEEDLQKMESKNGILLLSADCIYDESLTEAMMDAAYCLMKRSKGPAVLLVAMEKRFTFTLRDLDSRAPAYDHFVSLLHTIDEINQDKIGGTEEEEGVKKRMKGRRIDVRSTVPEAISCSPVHINRSLDLLELWQIELAP